MTYYTYWKCCRPMAGGLMTGLGLSFLSLIVLVRALVLLLAQPTQQVDADSTCPPDLAAFLCSCSTGRDTLLIGVIIASVVSLSANVDLVIAVLMKDRRLLWPWIVIFGLVWLALLAYAFFRINFLFNKKSSWEKQGSCETKHHVLGSIICAGLILYLWASVVEIFRRLKPGLSEKEIEKRMAIDFV